MAQAVREFRAQGKHFFLTYPRCPVPKEFALEYLLQLPVSNLEFVVVAEERHQDGAPHLHAAVGFRARHNVRNPGQFDIQIDEALSYHPNIQVCRSLKAVLAYVLKFGSYAADGIDVEAANLGQLARTSATASVAVRAVRGESLIGLFDEYPGIFLLHKKKIDELIAWHSLQMKNKEMEGKAELFYQKLISLEYDAVAGLSATERDILLWLSGNLDVTEARPFKQKQLYLYGPPNSGKTSLLMLLMQYFNTFVMPMEDFYDMFDETVHKLVVLDEFRAQKTIQFLNQWADGQVMCVRKKGSQALKSKNLPLMICSNFSLGEAYSKSDDAHLEALRARFKVVAIGVGETIFALVELIKRALIGDVQPVEQAEEAPMEVEAASEASRPPEYAGVGDMRQCPFCHCVPCLCDED